MTELTKYFANHLESQEAYIKEVLMKGLNCKNCPAYEYCQAHECYHNTSYDTCADIILEWGDQIVPEMN